MRRSWPPPPPCRNHPGWTRRLSQRMTWSTLSAPTSPHQQQSTGQRQVRNIPAALSPGNVLWLHPGSLCSLQQGTGAVGAAQPHQSLLTLTGLKAAAGFNGTSRCFPALFAGWKTMVQAVFIWVQSTLPTVTPLLTAEPGAEHNNCPALRASCPDSWAAEPLLRACAWSRAGRACCPGTGAVADGDLSNAHRDTNYCSWWNCAVSSPRN